MIKKIYSYLLLSIVIVACSKTNDVGIQNYTRKIDLSGSNASSYQNQATFVYSTDGGNTFVGFPNLNGVKNYLVKVVYNPDPSTYTFPDNGSIVAISPNDCYVLDWSSSNPKPISVDDNGVAEFSSGANNISVVVTNQYVPYSASTWLGGWLGDEGTVELDSAGVKLKTFSGSTDLSDFTQDPADPNKIWMTNIFGDGTAQKAYMELNPSTNNADQTITIPAQVTNEGLTFIGSGVYDQCRQTLTLNVNYSYIDAGVTYTYKWTYSFTKAPYCTYDASSWTGVWGGDETNTTCCGGTDTNNITQDPSVPNRFHMDNFWGDHVDAYFDLTPSTNYFDQIVTLPQQTTSEGGTIAAGTGTYNQCTGVFNMQCSYTFNGTTFYVWTYKFHR